MPKKLLLVVAILCGSVGAVGGWYLSSYFIPHQIVAETTTDDSWILAEVKGAKTGDIVYPPNEYFPSTMEPVYDDDLDLTAQGYAVMDRDTGELLLARNLTEERLIASVAKIMTAVVALEQFPLEAQLQVGNRAAHAGEAFMGLSEGETLTVEELLYGMMLPSGNDAAETLAEGLRPSDPSTAVDIAQRRRDWFLEQMNTKAHNLGMYDTYFFNPTGLDGDTVEASSFSTPLDLLALANYALNNKTFAQIAATKEYIVRYEAGKHKAFYLYNILEFDRTYPGIRGIKPGETGFAEETLVSYLDHDDRHIIVVLLESTATKDDAVKVYQFLENNP